MPILTRFGPAMPGRGHEIIYSRLYNVVIHEGLSSLSPLLAESRSTSLGPVQFV